MLPIPLIARNSLWENITATVRRRAAGRELILTGTSEAEEKYLTVQIIFQETDAKEFGEIIYDDKAALHLGASFLELPDENVFTDQTELLFIIRRGFGAVKREKKRRG